MAAQDVAELAPRVRRAIEGPIPLANDDPLRLDDSQLVALVADTIADLILLTEGRWEHTLTGVGSPPFTEWEVDPALTTDEESLVAAQAVLSRFFYIAREQKVSERIRNEGQEWEWSTSAQLIREQYKLAKEMRDAALAAILRRSPVLAQYASILAVRDRVAAAVIEPWIGGGLGGGQESRVPYFLPM